MKKIENGYCEYYYLTEDGRVFNEQTKEYKEPTKDNRFVLKALDGSRKKVTLKTLYRMVYNKNFCRDAICDLDGELWREVENTDGNYYISNMGRIKSLKGYVAIELKPTKTKQGYYRVDIVQDGMRFTKFIHRLVASAFLDMPTRIDMELHHKDHNKINNRVENLEWLTPTEHRKKHNTRSIDNAKLQ